MLSLDRIRRLDELRFIWVPKESQGADMYERLINFKKKYGHCNVPDKWVGEPPGTRTQGPRLKRAMLYLLS
jgi:hypothetical protein